MRTSATAKAKHKLFVQELVKNGIDQEAAYKYVYPEANPNTVRVNASKLMQTEEIQKELERQAACFTPDFILSSIGKLAMQGKKEDTQLRAWELLAKARSLFKNEAPSQQINVLAQFDTPDNRAGTLHNHHKDSITSDNVPTIDTTEGT